MTNLIIDEESAKQLVYLYHFCRPEMSAKRIHLIWYKSRIFKEYQRPTLEVIIGWMEEFKIEKEETNERRKN